MSLEQKLVTIANKLHLPLIRLALFVVYFWFGILKLVGTSPANPLVADLLNHTLPFLTFESFIIGFSIFEVLIGVLFLFSRFDRISLVLIAIHMVMTAGPLVLLPQVTWQAFFTPTLEGQYIIKNILIVTVAVTIAAHLKPRSLSSA